MRTLKQYLLYALACVALATSVGLGCDPNSVPDVDPNALIESGQDSSQAYDFAVKMNNRLFDWIENMVEQLFVYDENLDCNSNLEEIVQTILNDALGLSTNIPSPLLAPICLADIPLIGTICFTIYIADNDGNGVIVKLTSPVNPLEPIAPLGVGDPNACPTGLTGIALDIAGDAGADVYGSYDDDGINVDLIFDRIEFDLLLDDPTDASTVDFTFPDGTAGTCDQYGSQIFRRGTGVAPASGTEDCFDGPAGAVCPSSTPLCTNGVKGCCLVALTAPATGTANDWTIINAAGSYGFKPVVDGAFTVAPDGFFADDYAAAGAALRMGTPDPWEYGAYPANWRGGLHGHNSLWDYPDADTATTQDNDNNTWADATDYGCVPWATSALPGVGLDADGDYRWNCTSGPNGNMCNFYASTCDLSNWINLGGNVIIGEDNPTSSTTIQELVVSLSVRPLFQGNGTATRANTAFGIELKRIDFGTNLLINWDKDPELAMTGFPYANTGPQYPISNGFSDVISRVEAEVRAVFEDLFTCTDLTSPTSTDPNCIGYFLGPTRLFDVTDLIALLPFPFAHPLIPEILYNPGPAVAGESYQAGITMAVGITSGFIAEQNFGAMIGGNVFVDLRLVDMDINGATVPTTAPPYEPRRWKSCTIGSAGEVGRTPANYLPGMDNVYTPGGQRALWTDAPVGLPNSLYDHTNVGNNSPRIFYGNPGAPDWDEVDWPCKGGCAAAVDPVVDHYADYYLGGPSAANMSRDYMLGIGIHQDVVTEIVYQLVANGTLCIEYDPTRIYDATSGYLLADPAFRDLMNSSGMIFTLFFPELPANFSNNLGEQEAGSPIGFRIVPYLIDPNFNDTFATIGIAEGAAATGDCGASPYGYLERCYRKNQPRAWMGGSITDVIGASFVAATGDMWYNYNPVTEPIINPGTPSRWQYYNAQGDAWADIQVEIPHLLLEFYAYDCTANCAALFDARTYMGYRVFSVDFGIRLGVDIDILTATAVAAYPYRRVYHIGIIGDPKVKQLFTYIEDATTFAGDNLLHCPVTTGAQSGNPCSDAANLFGPGQESDGAGDYNHYTSQTPAYNGAYGSNGASYSVVDAENFIGNLIAILLDGLAEFEVEIELDLNGGLGDLRLPLAPNGLVVPSYNVFGAAPSYIGRTDWDDATSEGETYGDFLQVYLDIAGTITPEFVFDALDSLGVLASLGLSPKATGGSHELNLFELPANQFTPPETTIKAIEGSSPHATTIEFTGTDDQTTPENLRFSWRLDRGLWTPFVKTNVAYLKGLTDGVHVVQVRAIDDRGNLEPTPQELSFLVDGIGPILRLAGADRSTYTTDSPVFFLSAYDHVSKDDVVLHYSLDGQKWQTTEGDVALRGLSDGSHVLAVRATDATGNAVAKVHRFSVDTDSGYGCAATANSSPWGLGLVLLAPLAFIAVRRREGQGRA